MTLEKNQTSMAHDLTSKAVGPKGGGGGGGSIIISLTSPNFG